MERDVARRCGGTSIGVSDLAHGCCKVRIAGAVLQPSRVAGHSSRWETRAQWCECSSQHRYAHRSQRVMTDHLGEPGIGRVIGQHSGMARSSMPAEDMSNIHGPSRGRGSSSLFWWFVPSAVKRRGRAGGRPTTPARCRGSSSAGPDPGLCMHPRRSRPSDHVSGRGMG